MLRGFCLLTVVSATLAAAPTLAQKPAQKDKPGQEDKVDFRGVVLRVTPAAQDAKGVLGTILVESKVDTKGVPSPKALVTITDATKLAKLSDDKIEKREKATFADLKVGARVLAKFSGPALASDPAKATAAEVLILAPVK